MAGCLPTLQRLTSCVDPADSDEVSPQILAAFKEFNRKGLKCLAIGQLTEARFNFERAVRVGKQHLNSPPVALFNLGVALDRYGRHARAADFYLEAMERLPVGSARWAVAATMVSMPG